jgi:lipooligosaccharide transport system ATP-binding protein
VTKLVVTANGLIKNYGPARVVDGVSFAIAEGECAGFLGPNGAGKTTTMRILSCLSPRDGGTLEVLGHDPGHSPRELKARLGVVAQETNLDVELTVRENLIIYARYFGLTGAAARIRADELLETMDLAGRAGDAVEQLSGGMMRRLQIGRALINRPDLIILDEPTTGLDPQARQLVWARIRDLRARGVTAIITTHYMDEAAQLCDRLYLMDDGVITLEGAPDDLIARTTGAWALEFEDPAAEAAIGDLARAVRRGAGRTVVFTDDRDGCRKRLGPGGPPVRTERPATLEDVFLVRTGHALADGTESG